MGLMVGPVEHEVPQRGELRLELGALLAFLHVPVHNVTAHVEGGEQAPVPVWAGVGGARRATGPQDRAAAVG